MSWRAEYSKADIEYLKKHDWYGSPGLDFDESRTSPSCPTDMIDLSKARREYPMAAEECEEFKEVKALAGISHADNLAAHVSDMELEFNQFVMQMRKKFRILRSMITKN